MVNVKQAISLLEKTAKYVQACGKRSILECKAQSLKGINLSELRFAPQLEGDIVQISKTTTPRFLPLKSKTKELSKELAFVERCPKQISKDGITLRSIGSTLGGNDITYNIFDETGSEIAYCIIRGGEREAFFMPNIPKNWLDGKVVKPSIYIDNLMVYDTGNGKGRKIIQVIHELSQKMGCDGRLYLSQKKEANGFYTKLGFLNDGQIERYFEPNVESLKALYKH